MNHTDTPNDLTIDEYMRPHVERALALIVAAAVAYQHRDDCPPAGIERPAADQYEGKHPCCYVGCEHTVLFDDEPYCYTHSPDSGSNVKGYSYAQEQRDRVANALWGNDVVPPVQCEARNRDGGGRCQRQVNLLVGERGVCIHHEQWALDNQPIEF